MSGRDRCSAILRTPHVTPLLAASMLARLPFGMFALALVLYMAEERGSYAVAGLVDGAFGSAPRSGCRCRAVRWTGSASAACCCRSPYSTPPRPRR